MVDCMVDSDAGLMADVARGDAQAFRTIVEKYQDQVMATVYRFTGDYHQAEDLTQEVFVRVFKAAKRYKPKARFRTWLFKIVVNLCLNYRRDRVRRRMDSLDMPLRVNGNDVPRDVRGPDGDIPEVASEKGELREVIRDAINSLPSNQRLAVILRRFEEMSYREIAAALDVSVGAVESLLFRARQNLKTRLEPYVFSGDRKF
jgi:RNA polymerase sigma-70 factor (ECF subfamily)